MNLKCIFNSDSQPGECLPPGYEPGHLGVRKKMNNGRKMHTHQQYCLQSQHINFKKQQLY